MNKWKHKCQQKIILPDRLEETARLIRQTKKKIVTINGSFDLLHAGHLHILYEAAKQGDVLIVLVNSDQSIKNYKSPDRPLIPLPFRLQMLAAIYFIDYLTWFDETDPCLLLEKIKPDIHVNGAEYGPNCIEAETVKKYGGKVHLIELVEGLSTTEIIKKVELSFQN
ncbi:MAG: adenylyltransferase/cytidyltransferase family protein [Chlamydiales bacterium]